MARTLPSVALALLAAVAVLAPLPAVADAAAEGRLREALRSTTQQLRTAEDELARSRASEGALKKEVEGLRASLSTAQRRTATQDGVTAADLKRRLAEADGAGSRLKETLARCEAEGREAGAAAQAAQAERDAQATEVKSLQERLATADARNVRMYRVGRSIIDWIYAIGVEEAYEMRDPFLGLKRVEMENAAQSYADQLMEQRAKP
jgi:hypothetical protein